MNTAMLVLIVPDFSNPFPACTDGIAAIIAGTQDRTGGQNSIAQFSPLRCSIVCYGLYAVNRITGPARRSGTLVCFLKEDQLILDDYMGPFKIRITERL